jgi:hypothetical protein
MSGFELVAGVIGIFFVVGIAVGVLVVIALPQLRPGRRRRYVNDGRRYMNRGGWQEPPAGRDDDGKPPRWPGR